MWSCWINWNDCEYHGYKLWLSTMIISTWNIMKYNYSINLPSEWSGSWNIYIIYQINKWMDRNDSNLLARLNWIAMEKNNSYITIHTHYIKRKGIDYLSLKHIVITTSPYYYTWNENNKQIDGTWNSSDTS